MEPWAGFFGVFTDKVFEATNHRLGNCIGFIDGKVFPCQRPVRCQRVMYNG